MFPHQLDAERMLEIGLVPARVRATADQLRAAASAAAGGLVALDGRGSQTAQWSGAAANAYSRWADAFDTHAERTVMSAARSAGILETCADQVDSCNATIADVRHRLRLLVRTHNLTAASVVDADIGAQLARLWGEYEMARSQALTASDIASRGVMDELADLPGRPRSVGDHVGGAIVHAAQPSIDSVVTTWGLTVQLLYDREGWWDNVDASMQEWALSIAYAASNPSGALDILINDLIGAGYVEDGAYGAAIGHIASWAVPLRWLIRADGPSRGGGQPDTTNDGMALPLLNEAFALDLGRLDARKTDDGWYQDLSNEDLTRQVTTGTGGRNDIGDPVVLEHASRFTNEEVAREAVARVLLTRRTEILEYVARTQNATEPEQWLTLDSVELGQVVGVSVISAAPTSFRKTTTATVRVGYDPATDRIFVGSAAPGRPAASPRRPPQ